MKLQEILMKPSSKTVGILGAWISIFSLIIIAFLPWDFPFKIPGKDVFKNEIRLNSAQFEIFQSQLTLILIVDFIFLLGWFLSWPVFCFWIQPEKKQILKTEMVVLILGLLGLVADCVENLFQIAMLDQIRDYGVVLEHTFIAWQIILMISYILPYAAMLIFFGFSCQHINISIQERYWGFGLTIIALISKFIPTIGIIGDFWFLLLFLYIFFWLKRKSVKK